MTEIETKLEHALDDATELVEAGTPPDVAAETVATDPEYVKDKPAETIEYIAREVGLPTESVSDRVDDFETGSQGWDHLYAITSRTLEEYLLDALSEDGHNAD